MWLNCQKHAICASQLWQNSPLDCHPNHLTSETEKGIFGAKIQISFKISHTVICRDWWTGMMGTTSGTCSRGMPTRIACQFDNWNFKCLHNIFRNTNCWKEKNFRNWTNKKNEALQHWFPITKFFRQLMLLHKIFLQVCFHWLWIACLGRCHVSLEAAAQYYWWWKLSKINVTLL